jgi:hypothetical protein
MDASTPEITRDIYGMPTFVTFTVVDVERTVDWYVNGLDFIPLFTMPGPDGNPAGAPAALALPGHSGTPGRGTGGR